MVIFSKAGSCLQPDQLHPCVWTIPHASQQKESNLSTLPQQTCAWSCPWQQEHWWSLRPETSGCWNCPQRQQGSQEDCCTFPSIFFSEWLHHVLPEVVSSSHRSSPETDTSKQYIQSFCGLDWIVKIQIFQDSISICLIVVLIQMQLYTTPTSTTIWKAKW